MMTQTSNNDVLQSTMNSHENQRAKEMNPVNSSTSSDSFKYRSPLRPLSGYNIYFQLQRERILYNEEFSTEKFTDQDIIDVIQERYNNWAGIVSPYNRKYHNKKSKKISFGELATKISAKWKETDAETKALLNLHAKNEREKYFKVKREAEAALNISSNTPNSSDGNRCHVQNPVTVPCLACNHTISLGINRPPYTNKPEKLRNKGNVVDFDEDEWNIDFPDMIQQPNMRGMEQLLQCSKPASNGVGAKDTNPSLFQETYPITDFGIESYSRNKSWQNAQQNIAHAEAQMKYYHRRLRITYLQLQSTMNSMPNNVFPLSQLSEDADLYLPLDYNDYENLDTADDIFVEPTESSYAKDENYSSSFTLQDNEFLDMKPFPNVSVDSFDTMIEGVLDHTDDYNDYNDFSLF